MHVSADYTSERIGMPDIAISFVDETSGEEYEAHLTNIESTPWQLPMVGTEERFGTVLFLLGPVTRSPAMPGCLGLLMISSCLLS